MTHRIIWNAIVIITFTAFNFFLAWVVIDCQRFLIDIHPYYYYLVVSGWVYYILNLTSKFLQGD